MSRAAAAAPAVRMAERRLLLTVGAAACLWLLSPASSSSTGGRSWLLLAHAHQAADAAGGAAGAVSDSLIGPPAAAAAAAAPPAAPSSSATAAASVERPVALPRPYVNSASAEKTVDTSTKKVLSLHFTVSRFRWRADDDRCQDTILALFTLSRFGEERAEEKRDVCLLRCLRALAAAEAALRWLLRCWRLTTRHLPLSGCSSCDHLLHPSSPAAQFLNGKTLRCVDINILRDNKTLGDG